MNQERKRKISIGMKKRWEDSEFRKKTVEAQKRYFLNPKNLKEFKKRMRKKWENPEYRKMIVEAQNKGRARVKLFKQESVKKQVS